MEELCGWGLCYILNCVGFCQTEFVKMVSNLMNLTVKINIVLYKVCSCGKGFCTRLNPSSLNGIF